MEDGGIAHRLELRFHVWHKCWLLLSERTISAGALWVGVPLIETDAEEDQSCWWRVFIAMNEPDE